MSLDKQQQQVSTMEKWANANPQHKYVKNGAEVQVTDHFHVSPADPTPHLRVEVTPGSYGNTDTRHVTKVGGMQPMPDHLRQGRPPSPQNVPAPKPFKSIVIGKPVDYKPIVVGPPVNKQAVFGPPVIKPIVVGKRVAQPAPKNAPPAQQQPQQPINLKRPGPVQEQKEVKKRK
ncbi:hypothetical protein CPB83DRAFT_479691 [Crepidotus variabilis]|uniref:Uncharacterized protein n=1 Tax=Crepidotus variabilis TaxID=179855 RepID=A0A9P6ERW2_9AGAR|nr:hypothetical protein CPB83DRAFT_479691 [Crepidotus variabilis]